MARPAPTEPASPPATDGAPAWLALADALIQRDALLVRMGGGVPPGDLAGLVIEDEEVDRLLLELPGLDGAAAPDVGPVAAKLGGRIEELRAAFHRDLAEPSSMFTGICWNARLAPAEAEVLALLAAIELDPRRQRLVAYAQDNVTLPRATLATLRRMFPEPHPGPVAVGSDSRLRRAALVDVQDDGPWAVRMASVHPAVAWALHGDRSLDPDLPGDRRIVQPAGLDPAGDGLVLVSGGDRTLRLRLALEHAAGAGFLVCSLPAGPTEWEAVVREATISGLGVVLELGGDAELPASARLWIQRAAHVAWALSAPAELPLESVPERPWREVRADAREASPEEWEAALGRAADPSHRLNAEQLRLVARAYPGVGGDLGAAVRRLAGGHLDRLARRVRPSRGWADLVLPADQFDQLRELTARYRHRDTVYEGWGFRAVPSAGVVALFAGQSGTGKTLAAEIIAGELGLDLYKIDLSSVVSKYIGETEKNLERIFSAAAAGNLVLFFDEADALFGKRSEVSDAHDRYANIEVAYLLQRMESYDGLIVLATNLQKNIDQAFVRRIHVSVQFPLPEEAQRRAIWAMSFPPAAPVGDLDIDFLARQFKVPGGVIRNAAVGAAFLAVERGGGIAMETVMLALKREFQKMGRLRTEADFDRYFDVVKGDGDAAPAG